MRKVYLGFLILAAGVFTSCSTEDALEQNEASKYEIKLTTCINQPTRGANLEEQNTSILKGNQVGVTITGASVTVTFFGQKRNQASQIFLL